LIKLLVGYCDIIASIFYFTYKLQTYNFLYVLSIKLNLSDNGDGITGFKIAGSGGYGINKARRRIKVFVDSSVDSLESGYELKGIIESDTTLVNIKVFNEQGKPANAIIILTES
jgi:hypothetical protein